MASQADERAVNLDHNLVLEQLRSIGIEAGDTVHVTADLLRAGIKCDQPSLLRTFWVKVLKEAVGSNGTIVVVAFTKTFFRFRKNSRLIFDRYSASTSGALSRAFLEDAESVRSSHPTNSIVAWGEHANWICSRHTPLSATYSFIGDLATLKGKHLMLGTLDKKNAPAGFHYAQESIGETRTTPGVGFFQVYFRTKDNGLSLFTRWDGGGCSGAGFKTLCYHIIDNSINFGPVGSSNSALISIERSIEVCKHLLLNNRRYLTCDDKECLTCRGRFKVSGLAVVLFYLKFCYKNFSKIKAKILSRAGEV